MFFAMNDEIAYCDVMQTRHSLVSQVSIVLFARLTLTTEIAELVVVGIKLLILSCNGESVEEISEIVGEKLCCHKEVQHASAPFVHSMELSQDL